MAAVFVSDLRRAADTAQVALGSSGLPLLQDWRLRECDYGRLNGARRELVHDDRRAYVDRPYPDGESWRQAVRRAARISRDLPARWDGQRVLIIGHLATRWALDIELRGARLEELVEEDFVWQPAWDYDLSS